MAPHVFVEPITLAGMAKIRQAYFATDLKARLARYHAKVDEAFLGWADAWLAPEFRTWSIEPLLPSVGVPALLIRGLGNEYGTSAQLACIERAMGAGRVTRVLLVDCGHAPHRDRETAVLEAVSTFLDGRASP